MSLKTNVAPWDRWLRVAVGLGILALRFWGPRSPWALLGLVPLGTAFIGFCPAYTLFRAIAARR